MNIQLKGYSKTIACSQGGRGAVKCEKSVYRQGRGVDQVVISHLGNKIVCYYNVGLKVISFLRLMSIVKLIDIVFYITYSSKKF